MGDFLRIHFVFGLTFLFLFCLALLLVLAAFDVSYNHGSRRYFGMFFSTLLSIVMSCFFASVIGTSFAMNADPFYEARLFIPTFGMLVGNSMSGLAIGTNCVLNQLSVHGDEVEVQLSMGATRFEAGKKETKTKKTETD